MPAHPFIPYGWRIALILTILVAGSWWWLNRLDSRESNQPEAKIHEPEYIMSGFTTLAMGPDGLPKQRLHAEHMAYYRGEDTTELVRPKLEIYRHGRPPLNVAAEKGWVTSGNEVILLSGRVDMWEEKPSGERAFEVVTSDVRVLVDREYAETDQPATITGRGAIINAIGARAYFQDSRIELLSQVHARIQPQSAE
jgi:lipopolysaccharide export system protein LptC